MQQQHSHLNSQQYANDNSETLAQNPSATSSPHHTSLYHIQHQPPSEQQSIYNLNSLSDVNIPTSNSLQPIGN